jgi:peptide/nickel transport system substrate-binding protein
VKARFATAGSLAAILLIACAACSTQTSSAGGSATSPIPGGTVSVGIDSDPTTFDPTDDATLGEEQVLVSLYDSPLQIGASGQVEPDLAESWHFATPQKLILNFRPGVHYTDGTAFTAATAKFDLARQAETTSSYTDLYSDVSGLTVTGPLQLTITLKQADYSLLDVLAGRAAYMVSPTAVRKYGSKFGLHPVGTGPFTLVSYTPNYEVVMKKNPHYWQTGRPYLDGLVYRIIPDDTTKTIAVVSGELQTEDYVEPVDASRANGEPSVRLSKWTGTLTPYIPVNYHVAPLNNPNVREAISLAINRQSLAKNVFLGDATPVNSMLAPAYPQYNHSLPPIISDPAKAKQLLGGRHLHLTMQVPPTYTNEAQVMQQQLAAVGISVTLQSMDWTTLVNNFYKNNFQLQAEDVTGQWPNAQLILGGFFLPGGDYNGLNFADPHITSNLATAQSTASTSAAFKAYAAAQQAANAENIYIPIVAVSNLRISSVKLHGVPQLPDGYLDFREAWLS